MMLGYEYHIKLELSCAHQLFRHESAKVSATVNEATVNVVTNPIDDTCMFPLQVHHYYYYYYFVIHHVTYRIGQ